MAKTKRKNSDTLTTKKSTSAPKKMNPFEVHLNKEKFKILGRKNKHDRGLPGVSRAKAQKKRIATLGREFLEKNKTNKFKDNRIGRGGRDGTNDDLATARFVAEKIGQMKDRKKSLYNLNDEEVLTHRGQTLAEIEKHQAEPESAESEEEEVLDADFTEATHFGGGNNSQEPGDRKTAIEDMIAEAKRRKAEIAKEKDEVEAMTAQLDASYKLLIPVIGKLTRTEPAPKPPQDDYDRVWREMIFEPRGEVTKKLPSEEEMQRNEKERLEKLEQERLARMRGEDPDAPPKPTHRSADALDDGYMVDSDDDDQPTLAYDINEDTTADDNQPQAEDENLGDDSLEASSGEEGSSKADSDEESEEGKIEESKEEKEGIESEEEKEEAESEEGEEEEESDEDSMDDLKYSDSDSDQEPEEVADTSKTKPEKQETLKRKSNSEAELQEAKKRKRIKKAESQLPFTFDMPSSYEVLAQLLEKHTPDDQAKIVERIIKCHHPKLDASNKERMLKLFTYLMQHVNDLFSDAEADNIEEMFQRFDKISPHLYDLVQMNPGTTAACILEVIKEKYEEYKKNVKVFPQLDTVIFFKLVSNVFSTSDFRHPVVTPCFIFISHILSRARPRNRKDLSTGLFLATLVMEYTYLSKRFIPAAINFLMGIVFLSSQKSLVEIVRIIPPFQSRGPQNALLVLSEKFEGEIEAPKLLSADLVTASIDDDFKVRALNSAFVILKDFIENSVENVGLRFLLEPFEPLLQRINLELYPNFISDNFKGVQEAINTINAKSLKLLVEIEKKPKALRLMEPKIVAVHDDKRRPKMSKEKEMRAILMHKLKRETKGAVREIRRDNEFLAKIQIKKQLQSDKQRRDKVRKIFSEASLQQGELNALARSKKKNKF